MLQKKAAIFIIILLLIAGIIYYITKSKLAATVNGQSITRQELLQELEKRGGKQTLNALVVQTLILQEAKKRKIDVSQKEIDSEIKKIESSLSSQGQKLEDMLQYQGLTRDSFALQIQIQKLVEKMLLMDEKVSDKEISDYLAKNKDQNSKETDAKKLKEQARLELEQQKIKSKANEWVSNLQKRAKITYYVKY